MPRRPLFRTSVYAYHVTTRTNEQQFFKAPIAKVWRAFQFEIRDTEVRYGIETFHFILMGNHMHWVLRTPQRNIDLAMKFCLSRIAKHVQCVCNVDGHLWGRRYKYTVLDSEDYFRNVVKYVYQNPLRVQLAQRAEEYPFSTLRAYLRKTRLPFSLHDEAFAKDARDRPDVILEWLNDPLVDPVCHILTKALNGRRFSSVVS